MSKYNHFLLCYLCVSLALLSSCGDPLDDRYGTTDVGSINGCSILRKSLENHFDLTVSHLLSPRLEEEHEFLIHVARQNDLPDAEACEWLEDWLLGDSNRQAVLVLRQGNLTSWLCRRWAQQARVEAKRVPNEAASLEALAAQLEKRAQADEEITPLRKELSCDLFSWKSYPATVPTRISGLQLSDVPLAMNIGGYIDLEKLNKGKIKPGKKRNGKNKVVENENDELATALIQVQTSSSLIPGGGSKDEFLPWAVEIPMKNASRLIVIANALPLLDGAQPDPAARQLMLGLINHCADFHGEKSRAAWVNHFRVRGEGGPPNPLVAVLTTSPISWISWHLIAFLVVIAYAGARWLGRREPTRDYRHDQFSRHVLALAARLRDTHQASWCVRAIARVAFRYHEAPPSFTDEASARDWLRKSANAASPNSPPTQPAPKRSP